MFPHVSPLMHATEENQLEKVEHLLNSWVDVDGNNEFWGFTPLMAASYQGKTGIMKVLLSRNVNIETENEESDNSQSDTKCRTIVVKRGKNRSYI